jgi:hypothetical protein
MNNSYLFRKEVEYLQSHPELLADIVKAMKDVTTLFDGNYIDNTLEPAYRLAKLTYHLENRSDSTLYKWRLHTVESCGFFKGKKYTPCPERVVSLPGITPLILS